MAVSELYTTKQCCTCKQVKPLSDFCDHKRRPDGKSKRCRACSSTSAKAQYAKRKLSTYVAPEHRCVTCGEVKPASEFYRSSSTNYGLQVRCKVCAKARVKRDWAKISVTARKYYDANKDRLLEINWRRSIEKQFGLTAEQYDAMAECQAWACAICRKQPTERLAVDHCHQTGRVRGLLCRTCNQALGAFGDTADRLRVALAYLEGEGES